MQIQMNTIPYLNNIKEKIIDKLSNNIIINSKSLINNEKETPFKNIIINNEEINNKQN